MGIYQVPIQNKKKKLFDIIYWRVEIGTLNIIQFKYYHISRLTIFFH